MGLPRHKRMTKAERKRIPWAKRKRCRYRLVQSHHDIFPRQCCNHAVDGGEYCRVHSHLEK